MIEIVCDNRHSNQAGFTDWGAKNRLNTIFKSLKWQGLQESVKECGMGGCYVFCHPKASYDLSVWRSASKHSLIRAALNTPPNHPAAGAGHGGGGGVCCDIDHSSVSG